MREIRKKMEFVIRLGIAMAICAFVTIVFFSFAVHIGAVVIDGISFNLKEIFMNSLVYGLMGGVTLGGCISIMFTMFILTDDFI